MAYENSGRQAAQAVAGSLQANVPTIMTNTVAKNVIKKRINNGLVLNLGRRSNNGKSNKTKPREQINNTNK